MEPVTLTATTIATIAFTKFIEGGAGKAAEKFAEAAFAKMDELRKQIWSKLRGRPGIASMETEIEQAGTVSPDQMEDISAYLRVVMKEDPGFATEIQTIAHEITLMQTEDNSSMTQNIYDNARGWQTRVTGGTAYIGEIHINQPPQS